MTKGRQKVCLIQHFEADFLWKVSLKILNSGLILTTFTHVLALGTHNKKFNEPLSLTLVDGLMVSAVLTGFFLSLLKQMTPLESPLWTLGA